MVGVIGKDQTETQVKEYLDELAFLAETAGAITIRKFTQKLPIRIVAPTSAKENYRRSAIISRAKTSRS